jgi:methionyl-tRNA formyltransferase
LGVTCLRSFRQSAAKVRAMRIAFLGTPDFTLPLLEACARAGELALVVAQPDRPVGRSSKPQPPPAAKWAREHGVRLEQPEKVKLGRLAAILASAAPDVAVVAAYGRILPADALAAPRNGCLNVHASLLPELRGAAPAQWAIARGLSETGVTIMQMDEGLDTGDIRLQKRLAIAPGETGESLLPRLGALGAEALVEALELLARGALPRAPQDHSRATLAPILTRDDGRVDFGRSALECVQRRRGFTPWPGAWTTLSGAVLKIHAATPIEEAPARPPGEILSAGAAGIDVACAGSVWRLLELQLEGKKRLAAGPFLSGARLQPGDRLGT